MPTSVIPFEAVFAVFLVAEGGLQRFPRFGDLSWMDYLLAEDCSTATLFEKIPKDVLPPGWTQAEVEKIQSFFRKISLQQPHAGLTRLAEAEKLRSRTGFTLWAQLSNGLKKSIRLACVLDGSLRLSGVNPLQLFAPEGLKHVPLVDYYVAKVLLGDEAVEDGAVREKYYPLVSAISKGHWSERYRGSMNEIAAIRSENDSVMDDKASHIFSLCKVREAASKRAQFKAIAQFRQNLQGGDEMEVVSHKLCVIILSPCLRSEDGSQDMSTIRSKSDVGNVPAVLVDELIHDVPPFHNDVSPLSPSPPKAYETHTVEILTTPPQRSVHGEVSRLWATDEDLCVRLGFQGGIPLSFSKSKSAGKDYSTICVHAIINACFSPTITNAAPMILVADEEGCRRATQFIQVLAYFVDTTLRQERSLPFPPIMIERRFLGPTEYHTSKLAPILIVAPGNLCPTWKDDITSSFDTQIVQVQVYENPVEFWRAFREPETEGRKIIIACHSDLQEEFGTVFEPSLDMSKQPPWKNGKRQGSLFDTSYSVVLVDALCHNDIVHPATLQVLSLALCGIVTIEGLHTPAKTCRSELDHDIPVCRNLEPRVFADGETMAGFLRPCINAYPSSLQEALFPSSKGKSFADLRTCLYQSFSPKEPMLTRHIACFCMMFAYLSLTPATPQKPPQPPTHTLLMNKTADPCPLEITAIPINSSETASVQNFNSSAFRIPTSSILVSRGAPSPTLDFGDEYFDFDAASAPSEENGGLGDPLLPISLGHADSRYEGENAEGASPIVGIQ